MSDGTSILHPTVSAALAASNIRFEAVPCRPELADTAEFCAHYGVPPEDACNTILVAMKTTPRTYVACLVRSDMKLDVNHRVTTEVGFKRLSFASSEEAWMRRVQSGQAGEQMVTSLAGELGGAPLRYFADWTDRIARGELPHAQPTRPQGVERNVVVTTWDWLNDKHYLHDLVATSRTHPTVNAYGPVYGSPEYSTDVVPILDPIKHTVTTFIAPVRDADTPVAAVNAPLQPSPYWGNEPIWSSKANNHNTMSGQTKTNKFY